MTDVKACGVCIGSRPRGDNDKMLDVFCDDGNVYGVLARGALKPKYKLKFATQLFSACNYYLCPSKAGYYILGGADFGELSFLRISNEPQAFAAACFVCEVANKCVKVENKRMYAETVAALGELASFEDVCAHAVCLRILLAAFVSCGLGAQIPAGEKGAVCEKLLGAELGSVSLIAPEKSVTFQLIRQYASRFTAHFGKLNSLSTALSF
ncbi:DNA repair protein RecO [Pumilibacter muris]|uniref:DNA repair protein RecO n=1 Tax=Pumilibacter muris TaxID=2941510 RepID=UPI00203E57F6|nr:recombination protein O N-terminal domain-containing protein [Pumilibacter muris]